MRTRQIDSTVEKNMVTGMIISDRYLKEVQVIYNPALMAVPFARTVANWCCSYYSQYQKAPMKDIQAVYEKKRQKGLSPEQADLIGEFLEILSLSNEQRSDELNVDFLLDETVQYLKARSLDLLAEDIRALNLKGDVAGAEKLQAEYKPIERTPSEAIPPRRAIVTCLADVKETPMKYLWDPYIPLSKLTIAMGDPNMGKSFFSMALATIISQGWDFPDLNGIVHKENPFEKRNILYLDAENGLGDTMKPRLREMGADFNFIHAITGVALQHTANGDSREAGLTLQKKDLEILENSLIKIQPTLLIIDPVQAFLTGADMYRPNEVRPVLAELSRLAEKHECSVLVIGHLRKAQAEKVMHAGMGSIDFFAAARSVLLIGRNPRNPDERAIVHIKHNNSAAGDAIGFELKDGIFRWTGTSMLTAHDLLAPDKEKEGNGVPEIEDFLRDILKDGQVSATEVFKQGKEFGGYSVSTLHRAKDKMGIEAHKLSKTEGWVWRLPRAERLPRR